MIDQAMSYLLNFALFNPIWEVFTVMAVLFSFIGFIIYGERRQREAVNICPNCGQVVKQAHKEFLNKHKLTMLQRVAHSIAETHSNDFDIQSVIDDTRFYNNFQKLRYHGLIFHVESNGMRQRGHWGITRNGWSFLRGELDLPKWVIIQNNHITSRSVELLNVRQVYYGAEVIETTFEYFDEQGNMVGVKPIVKTQPEQSMLFA